MAPYVFESSFSSSGSTSALVALGTTGAPLWRIPLDAFPATQREMLVAPDGTIYASESWMDYGTTAVSPKARCSGPHLST